MPFSLFSSAAAAPSIPLPITNSPLPKLFVGEAILKVLGGSLFFFSPTLILRNLASPPYPASSLSLIQSVGTQTLAFSIPLFLASRSDLASVKSRRIVYFALLARESFLGLGLLGQLGFSYAKEWWRDGFRDARGKRISTKEKLLALARGSESEFVMPGGWEEEGEDMKVLMEREEQERLRRGLLLWIMELVPFVVGRVWILRYKPQWFD